MELKRLRPLLLGLLLVFLYTAKYWHYPNIPSPIYGGDYWHQLSYLYHVADGGGLFESSVIEGEVPGYMPIYPLLGALPFSLLEKAFDPVHAFYATAILIGLLTYGVLYWVLRHFSGEGDMLAFAFLLLFSPIPPMKYTEVAALLVGPLTLYAVFSFLERPNTKRALFLGFSFGLMALSHVVGFLSYSLFFALLLLKRLWEKRGLPWKELVLAAAVAVPIALLYWWKPLAVYHLSFAYDRIHMDLENLGDPYVAVWMVGRIISSFIGPLGLLLLLSLPALRERPFPFLAALAVMVSYFITEPLFHANLPPTYVEHLLLMPLLFIYTAQSVEKSRYRKEVALALALVGVALFYLYTPPFASVPVPAYLLESASWLRAHSSVYDVVLSTKELSFALNALTGRKMVAFRWAHLNNPYIKVWGRDRDAALMLYSNNTSLVEKLLKDYNVSYLYWDKLWVVMDYRADETGGIYPIDPFILFPSAEDELLLRESGIPYQEVHYWLDPSQRSPFVKRFPALFILPSYRSAYRPWSPALDRYLEEAYTYGSPPEAAVYRVRIG